jgi:hypothetical protein
MNFPTTIYELDELDNKWQNAESSLGTTPTYLLINTLTFARRRRCSLLLHTFFLRLGSMSAVRQVIILVTAKEIYLLYKSSFFEARDALKIRPPTLGALRVFRITVSHMHVGNAYAYWSFRMHMGETFIFNLTICK